MSNIEEVTTLSDKVNKVVLPHNQSLPDMLLPKSKYEPFFMKVLIDFIEHHNLSKELPVPRNGLLMHMSMSCILNIMVETMGKEKKKAILEELEAYKSSLPFDVR